jgi:hypothetical protein
MSGMSKPRPDSIFAGLEEDQITTLCEWLLTPNLTYKAVRDLCGAEFGLYPSNSQLSRFYSSYVAKEVIARRARAVQLSNEVGEDLEKSPGNFDKVTIDALRRKALALAEAPMTKPSDIKAIFSLVLKARDQDQKDKDIAIKLRRLEALERQEKDAQGILKDGSLSLEEREARMKEKFGIS